VFICVTELSEETEMYKKRNLMLLAILLLSLILAACGATTPTAAPTPVPTVNTTPIPTATLAPTKVAQLEPKGGTWKTWHGHFSGKFCKRPQKFDGQLHPAQ
jgi:nitrous oxide reductase accessory protein NosL